MARGMVYLICIHKINTAAGGSTPDLPCHTLRHQNYTEKGILL